MNLNLRFALLLPILMALSSIGGFAQNSPVSLDKGVKAHAAIDAIYAKFAEAYKNLTPAAVSDLYTVDADYLPGGEGPLKGRAAILENFTGFFNGVKERGQKMDIAFQITQREVTGELGYDIGVYTLTISKDGTQVHQGKGRFIVVTKKVGGKWYFQLDTYNNLPHKK